jgi:Zn-dependent protease
MASYEISSRSGRYSSPAWNALEYFSLFAIVLLHEFGHAFACRQVGGEANYIVLWPLGGIALAKPPPRPGATLWTIVAGPLVNVALWPVLRMLEIVSRTHGWAETFPDLDAWIHQLAWINLGLLIFNVVPLYPLDGGQILRCLLWFPLGPIRSLLIATSVGFVGVAGVALLALQRQSLWLGVIALFLGSNCWQAFQYARAMQREKLNTQP